MRTVRLGVRSLMLHKLRSLLTTLGVLFGTSSVIAMLAIGEGGSEEAQEQIRMLGSRNVIMRSIKPPDQAGNEQTSRVLVYGLTFQDLERAKSSFPGVKRVVPVKHLPEEVRVGEYVCNPQILASDPSWLEVTGRTLIGGRFITEGDDRMQANVCVLDYGVARTLFPFTGALHETVRIGGDYFKVVGILRSSSPLPDGPTPEVGEELGQLLIPMSTSRAWYGDRMVQRKSGSMDMQEVQLHEIVAQVDSDEAVPIVASAAREMLRRNHTQQDYEVIVPLELLLRARETKRIFNIVLGSIAGISLLVGGIGIMNVMLATVTERTREIGIRRALGAKRHHIVTQFLVETVVLSVGGGLLGIVLGVAIPKVVEHFTDLRAIVTPEAPMLAFGISALTGIVFGIYPAWRAAHMDPVEALRHE